MEEGDWMWEMDPAGDAILYEINGELHTDEEMMFCFFFALFLPLILQPGVLLCFSKMWNGLLSRISHSYLFL